MPKSKEGYIAYYVMKQVGDKKDKQAFSSRPCYEGHRYQPKEIEGYWQAYWQAMDLYRSPREDVGGKPTCYVLDMFPYPSGEGLHVGHPLGYIATDIYARYRRMCGYAVLHPMGFDSFGLPAEQYAIETGQHPEQTTRRNIARYCEQLRMLGLSYDWSLEVRTSDPAFYRWTQWMFKLFFDSWYNLDTDKAEPIETLCQAFASGGTAAVQAVSSSGQKPFTAKEWNEASSAKQHQWLSVYRLAYLDDAYVNWCPSLGTVLSNDEVKDGLSERGGHKVEKRKMRQWMLGISAYAQRLVDDLEGLDWPNPILEMQRHWIGRSLGAEIDFLLLDDTSSTQEVLTVYTTRPDTIYGVTFIAASAEVALERLVLSPQVRNEVIKIKEASSSPGGSAKSPCGCFTGCYVRHPLTEAALPIWVTDYALADYGSGIVMSVPAHDARDYVFAQAYKLPITKVIEPLRSHVGDKDACCGGAYQEKEGTLIDSGVLTGLSVAKALVKAVELLEERGASRRKVNYRLRDAIFARQRYWGEPVPVYYKEGVPYCLAEAELPLSLPSIDAYLPTDEGLPPLGRAKGWKTAKGHAYELSTMPGWAGSSWYFFRYMDPQNSHCFASKEALERWKAVDLYVGGAEHAVGHLLYARFWTKFLYDRGLVSVKEFASKLVNQGMILGTSFFVYRLKSDANTYVSAGKAKDYEVQELHVENYLVHGADHVLDTKGFCKSRKARVGSKFILESDGRYCCGSRIEKMSKSRFNVVNPDELIERYGADTLRLYEMFLGPIDQNKPWDTRGMDGPHRFLNKCWRLFHTGKGGVFHLVDHTPDEEELGILHRAIAKVRADTENMAFNTAISALMVAVGELQRLACCKREVLMPLVLLICPYAPHMAEELWRRAGGGSSACLEAYPVADMRYTAQKTLTYVLSVNGKRRAEMQVAKGTHSEEIKKAALRHERMVPYLRNKEPKRIIFVEGKLVNIVC